MTEQSVPKATDDDGVLPRNWSVVLSIVGAAGGLGAHLFIEHNDSIAWQLGPSLGLLAGCLAFCLTIAPRRWPVGTLAAPGLGLLLAALTTTAVLRFGPDAEGYYGFDHFGLVVEAVIVAAIVVPFLQTWQGQGRLHFPYHRLFAHAWNNGLVIGLSAAFTGIFWLILWLFALLFRYVGFGQLERLIEEPGFAWPATTAAMALGIFAGRDYQRVVVAVRRVVFSLFALLTPLYLVLSFAFLVALSFGGFTKLSTVLSASGTLITLIIIGVILFNSLLRDGSAGSEVGRLLGACARLMPLALTGLCGYAAYAIYLRIDQYGLTPERVWIAVAVAVLSLHALAYLASLAWSSGWMTKSRQANIGIAGAVVLIALTLQTPWGDPYRLSAESQYRRLVGGHADAATFDYGFLRFQLGTAGTEALERIAADSGTAPREIVERRLATLRTTTDYWRWKMTMRDDDIGTRQLALHDPAVVRRVPADLDLPEDLNVEDRDTHDSPIQPLNCRREPAHSCLITATDLTDSPGPEFLYASVDLRGNLRLYLLEKSAGRWRSIYLQTFRNGQPIFQTLLEGGGMGVPANHRDLQIGEVVIHLRRID